MEFSLNRLGAIDSMTLGSPQKNLRSQKPGGLLLKVSQYLYVTQGQSFSIQVQEDPTGHYTAYAESTSDPHEAFSPMSGSKLEDVLESITQDIEKRVNKW